MRILVQRIVTAVTLLLGLALPVEATWSIVAINVRTGEVGAASVTCLANFDLRRGAPVILVGMGTASAQGLVDMGAINRATIREAFEEGVLMPADILADVLDGDFQVRRRAYNILSFAGPPATFLGERTNEGKLAVSGQTGDYVYSVVGSGLAGRAVVTATADAFRDTPGDMGQRFLAALQAGRALGGDGRCSCDASDPDSCGTPPPSFEKSGHCGYVIVARHGDIDGGCNQLRGCAAGAYHLNLNVRGPNSAVAAPDPVEQLQALYDTWRSNRVGRPDGILSEVDPVPALPADGLTKRRVTVRLRDVDGQPLAKGGAEVRVGTLGGLRSLVSLGPVRDHGDGTYSFTITAGRVAGTDTFVITATDGGLRATLYPYLEVPSLEFRSAVRERL